MEGNGDNAPAGNGAGSGSSDTRSGRALWKGMRTAVTLSNAFQTLRSMSAENYIEPSQLTVVKRLGEGAFATVDLCWVTRPGQGQKLQAAVKRLKPEIFTQQEDLAAFIKEADLLRKMRHSYIVEYIGMGAMDTSTPEAVQASSYLVQEYMAGGTLKRMVYNKQLACGRPGAVYRAQDALRWALQVAKALRYMHDANPMVIHRDLKLENVLLQGPNATTMVAKVADFGLCACVDTWINRKRTAEGDNQRRLHPTPEDLPADALEAAANSQAGAEGAGDAQQQQADPNLGQLEQPAVKEGQEGAAAAALDTKPIQDSGALLPAAMEAAPGRGLQPAAGKAPPPMGRTLKHSLSGINAALRAKRPEAGTETFRLSGHTGSLLYMAPEVYSGHDYNHKVDVFSFGVVMLELFSGRVLSTVVAPNGTFGEIDSYSKRVALAAYRPPIPGVVPAPIAALIQRCWAQEAAERPSMEEVVQALQQAEGAAAAADAEAVAWRRCGCF